MIKKYPLDNNHGFYKRVMCSLYEGEFNITLTQKYEEDVKSLFEDYEYIKFSAPNSPLFKLTVVLQTVYLEEENQRINALILLDQETNNYYLLLADPNDEENKKYSFRERIHSDVNKLETTYENNKLRKKYGGISDVSLGNESGPLRVHFRSPQPKEPEGIVYIFHNCKNNKFSVDFIQLFQNRMYRATGLTYDEKDVALNLDEMTKTRNDRLDSFYIEHSGQVNYFIYSNVRHDVPHYYLFRNNYDKTYSLIYTSTSYEKLLGRSELADHYYVKATPEQCNALAKVLFRDYAFAKEEELDDDEQLVVEEQIEKELEQFADKQINDIKRIFKNQKEVIEFIEQHNGYVENGLVMFKEFEDFPLASLTNEYIKIRATRYPNNVDFSAPLSIKKSKQNKVYERLADLLLKEPSSRLKELEKLIDKAIEFGTDEGSYLDEEIRYLYESLLDSDKNYPVGECERIVGKYEKYRKTSLKNICNESAPERKQLDVIDNLKTYSKYVNKGKKLIIIGATIGNGALARIKQIANSYGFKKNDVETYGFFVNGLDVDSLQNPNKKRNTILIVGASDHKIEKLTGSDSLKGAIQNNPESYPPTKFAVDGNGSLCNLSSSKFEKLLKEFRDEGIIN